VIVVAGALADIFRAQRIFHIPGRGGSFRRLHPVGLGRLSPEHGPWLISPCRPA